MEHSQTDSGTESPGIEVMASQDRDRLEVMVLEAQGLLAVEGMIGGTIRSSRERVVQGASLDHLTSNPE